MSRNKTAGPGQLPNRTDELALGIGAVLHASSSLSPYRSPIVCSLGVTTELLLVAK